MQTEDGAMDEASARAQDEAEADAEVEAEIAADVDAEEAFSDADDAEADAASAEPEKHVCPVGFCPIGMALSTMDRSGPDALEHLLAAGREVLLAAKAMVDARASDVAVSPDLEKIEVH